jgi:hypothetical protein
MICTENYVKDYYVQSNIQKDSSLWPAYCLWIWGGNRSVLYLQRTFVGTKSLDTSDSKLYTSGKFWNVRLEKDGDNLVRLCEKWSSIIWRQGGEDYNAYNRKTNAKCTGRFCSINCLGKNVIEGKIELMGRRGK